MAILGREGKLYVYNGAFVMYEPPTLDSITITPPTKTSYFIGDTLNLAGMVVTGHYSDGSAMAVSGWTSNPVAGTVLNEAGTKTITITYTERGVTKTGTFNITVSVAVLDSVSVKSMPTKTSYDEGDTLDLTGLVVEATYTDGSKKNVSGYTTNPANGAVLSTSDTTVTITYTE